MKEQKRFVILMRVISCMMLVSMFLLVSCRSTKKVIYLQDVDPLKQQEIEQKYEVIIHKDDLLAIMVNSKNPELAVPFNMPMVTYELGRETTGQYRVLGYLVDADGYIDFPILGKIHVEGLTRLQLTDLIKQRLIDEDLIKDPIVTVQFLNFKISVMGEVARPGSFEISGDRITLLYYLQQNDIVYVEPNKAKAGQSGINQNNSVSVWLSVVSVLATVASLIVTLTNK